MFTKVYITNFLEFISNIDACTFHSISDSISFFLVRGATGCPIPSFWISRTNPHLVKNHFNVLYTKLSLYFHFLFDQTLWVPQICLFYKLSLKLNKLYFLIIIQIEYESFQNFFNLIFFNPWIWSLSWNN